MGSSWLTEVLEGFHVDEGGALPIKTRVQGRWGVWMAVSISRAHLLLSHPQTTMNVNRQKQRSWPGSRQSSTASTLSQSSPSSFWGLSCRPTHAAPPWGRSRAGCTAPPPPEPSPLRTSGRWPGPTSARPRCRARAGAASSSRPARRPPGARSPPSSGCETMRAGVSADLSAKRDRPPTLPSLQALHRSTSRTCQSRTGRTASRLSLAWTPARRPSCSACTACRWMRPSWTWPARSSPLGYEGWSSQCFLGTSGSPGRWVGAHNPRMPRHRPALPLSAPLHWCPEMAPSLCHQAMNVCKSQMKVPSKPFLLSLPID